MVWVPKIYLDVLWKTIKLDTLKREYKLNYHFIKSWEKPSNKGKMDKKNRSKNFLYGTILNLSLTLFNSTLKHGQVCIWKDFNFAFSFKLVSNCFSKARQIWEYSQWYGGLGEAMYQSNWAGITLMAAPNPTHQTQFQA